MAKKTLREFQEELQGTGLILEQVILAEISGSSIQDAEDSAQESNISLELQLLFDWYNL